MSKSPLKRLWPLWLLLVVALAVGWWWRTQRTATPPPATQTTTVTAPASAVPNPAASAPATSSAPAAKGEDFRAELDKALGNRDARQRSRQFGQLLRQWFERDPDAVLAYLRQM